MTEKEYEKAINRISEIMNMPSIPTDLGIELDQLVILVTEYENKVYHKMKKFRIELGENVSDKITGFTGIVMGRADYATGCDQYNVQPINVDSEKARTEFIEGRWFDDARLQVLPIGKVDVLGIQGEEPGCDITQAPTK